jgi:hypothetical protein
MSDDTEARASNDDEESVALTKPAASLRWITHDSTPMARAFAAAKATNSSTLTYSMRRLAMRRSTRSILTERSMLIRLLTNLTDPEQAPAAELASLYAERWQTDQAFGKPVTTRAPPKTLTLQPPIT